MVCLSLSFRQGLEVVLSSLLKYRKDLPRVVAAMNTNFPGGLQYPSNTYNAASVAQTGAPFAQRNLVPFSNYFSEIQSQVADFQKALSCSLLQYQFLQNFAFLNSQRFHPHQLGNQHSRSVSHPNLCTSIEQKLLEQICTTYAGGGSTASTRAPSPVEHTEGTFAAVCTSGNPGEEGRERDLRQHKSQLKEGEQEEEEIEDWEESMHSRGIKWVWHLEANVQCPMLCTIWYSLWDYCCHGAEW